MSKSPATPNPAPQKKPLNRRRFLKYMGAAAASGLLYSSLEACWIDVDEQTLQIPRLPHRFSGKRIALLTDIHHGPFTGLSYVRKIVELTHAHAPDLILLAGDYVHRDGKYIDPVFSVLKDLHAPLGVFGVLGNHDHWEGAAQTKNAMRQAGIVELTNAGIWLSAGGERLRIAGVGDLWEDDQDLNSALGDTAANETAILLSHNPDYVENISDPRVGLVLSGHTHGGQVVLPVFGAPVVPSRFGQKYLRGLVKTAATQVFVSRGLGTITPPLRFCCRPELNLITLA